MSRHLHHRPMAPAADGTPPCRLLALSLPLLLLFLAGCVPSHEGADRVAPVPAQAEADEILAMVRHSEAKAVLVNVWATWCAPCREEFPDLMRLRQRHRDQGFDLILVSADFDTPLEEIQGFLTEQGVDFPSYLKAGADMPFIEALDPGWSGALPASFLFDGDGVRRRTWEGKVSYEELAEQVRNLTG